MADAVGAAVYVEQNPMNLASGDEITAAPTTGTALGVMAFYVTADLLATTQDFTLWAEKKIIRDHADHPPGSWLP